MSEKRRIPVESDSPFWDAVIVMVDRLGGNVKVSEEDVLRSEAKGNELFLVTDEEGSLLFMVRGDES